MEKISKKVVRKVLVPFSYIPNKIYEKKCQKKIKNKDFSILCSTCIGGVIYHRLGMKFLSPTINLWIDNKDFIKMCCDLKYYMNLTLEKVDSEYSFPVGCLGGEIKIYFNHYKTFEEAEEKWIERKNRINYNNLYVICFLDKDMTVEDVKRLNEVECKNRVVFSPSAVSMEMPEYVKVFTPTKIDSKCRCMDKDLFGFRTFEKQFDFVRWLNGEEEK